jgi:hypothetical protein
MDEGRVNQLLVLMDEKRGKVGAPSTIVRFPRAMKRGAKVRRGPCAQIVQFPAPLAGAELRAEWFWLKNNHCGWNDERLPTSDDLTAFDEARFDRAMVTNRIVRFAFGEAPITEVEMRQDIAKWRAQIEKRAQVKDWIEELGVDWKNAFEPEQALFFIYDRLHASEQPASA